MQTPLDGLPGVVPADDVLRRRGATGLLMLALLLASPGGGGTESATGRESSPGGVTAPVTFVVPPGAGPSSGVVGSARAGAPASGRSLRLPLSFVENAGQLGDPRIAYTLQGRDQAIHVTARGLIFLLDEGGRDHLGGMRPAALSSADGAMPSRWALGLEFVGARAAAPEGSIQAPGRFSYFAGPGPRSRTGVRSYSQLAYRGLWPGIDLLLDATVDRVKYSFVVHPGADPAQIRFAWRGSRAVTLDAAGGMTIATPVGNLYDDRPVAWQQRAGGRVGVRAAFRELTAATTIAASDAVELGFALGRYDPSRELIIDPVFFVYAGFIGGCCDDRAFAVAVDSQGSAYVVGRTQSPETTFPDGDGFGAVPGFDQTHHAIAGFVARLNPSGTALIYATYFEGSGFIEALAVDVDDAGNAYVTGRAATNETLFLEGALGSVPGPDPTYNGGMSDAFVVKLDPTGTALLYAGFIGGDGDDSGQAIAVDGDGSAYVAGFTGSDETTFPDGDGFDAVPGMDQSANGVDDAFLVKIDPTGATLTYATYLGGAGSDAAQGVAVDALGNAFVAGSVGSASDETSFPDGDGLGVVPGFDLTHNGGIDAFVAKIDPTGTAVVYAGFLGGSGDDGANGIAVGGDGSAYVVGLATSDETTFPDGDGFGALGGPDTSFNGGSSDAFVAKLDPSGLALTYAGYVGGSSSEFGRAIAVAADGSAYLGGQTGSDETEFPDGDGFGALMGADTTYNGSQDAFAVKVSPAGDGFAWASYVGGSQGDQGFGLDVDGVGGVYVVGNLLSDETTFPDGDGLAGRPGPDSTYNTNRDAFVVKLQEAAIVADEIPLSRHGLALLALLLGALGIAGVTRLAMPR